MAMAGAVLVAAIAALLLPAPSRLELYDVQDLTYSIVDMPGVDISLAGCPDPVIEVDLRMTGMELAGKLQFLSPESPIHFQNGLLIVRASPSQHAAIRGALLGYRARNLTSLWIIDRLDSLLGMITR